MESKGDGVTVKKSDGNGNGKKNVSKKIEPIDGFTSTEMEIINDFGLYTLVKDSRVIVDYEKAKATITEKDAEFARLIAKPSSTDRDKAIINCLQAKTDAQTIIDNAKEPLATSNTAKARMTELAKVLIKAIRESRIAIESSTTALSEETEIKTENTEEVTN